MPTIQFTKAFEAIDCPSCGVVFAIDGDYNKRRRENGNNFYCPNGHVMSYDGELDRLRKKVKAEEEARAKAERQRAFYESCLRDAEATIKAQKAEARRQRQRAKAGACPCCNRSFVQLARHMKTKHPDYAEAAESNG